MSATKVFHPRLTFDETVKSFARFMRDNALAGLAGTTPEDLERLAAEQFDDAEGCRKLEQEAQEYGRSFAKRQRDRFKTYMRVLKMVREHYRYDSAKQESLDRFTVMLFGENMGSKGKGGDGTTK